MTHVFSFGNGAAEGDPSNLRILGGKGSSLHEMTRLGVPVPPGFTISAELCTDYLTHERLQDGLRAETTAAMRTLESAAGRVFGDGKRPLLVAVRSGAAASMPGMMDTVLNLGLNDTTATALAEETQNSQFAYDSYRRFVQMYGDVVCGVRSEAGCDPFDAAANRMMTERGVTRVVDLETDDLIDLIRQFQAVIQKATGHPIPVDPWEQLWHAIEAVFRSWRSKRAIAYRQLKGIPDHMGTAVNIVAMVYGNMGDDSGTGVVFTRNPSTGEPKLFGEFLTNAQGEDVVAGTRDPLPISELASALPTIFEKLSETCELLERHFCDVQDVEFTVERGRLYILQTRTATRTAPAAVRIAVDLTDASLVSKEEALCKLDASLLEHLLHPTVADDAQVNVLAVGLPASPGAAVGRVVFDPDRAEILARDGEPVVLLRKETTPEDFHGMVVAGGIVTQRGGMTSHAAVVARGMGKPCVAGCVKLDVDLERARASADGHDVVEGDWVTVDGSRGRVILGSAPLTEPGLGEHFERLMCWADESRLMRVRANADTPADAEQARGFGAEGIGLCRTEHMFFEGDRIDAMREMIVATDSNGRNRALMKLLPMQRQDFEAIFEIMDGLPVTIRLLDPPLHEFLPRGDDSVRRLALELNTDFDRLNRLVDTLAEQNPMLGHRGCRLLITYPEIAEMQIQAICEAACAAHDKGVHVLPEIMIPLVSHVEEFRRQRDLVRETANRVFDKRGVRIEYELGTMIEIPRAALTADVIAAEAQFFSFGTNDLTQTMFGLSRDDSNTFLPYYIQSGILPVDPFLTIDRAGVGAMMEIGVTRGRKTNPKLKVGICGEHGGDPKSIEFCHRLGINYVSCSPFRVPIARLAAAQAALRSKEHALVP